MSIAVKLVLAILTIGTFGCASNLNCIIPVDFVKYEKEFVPGLTGLTQKDVDKIFARQLIEINQNTIDKELPNIMVMNMQSRQVKLKSVVNGQTLLCLSGAHCGWGIDALVNGVPGALKKAKNEDMKIKAVCLFIKEDPENENMEIFNSKLNELRPLYKNLFIISSQEAKRLNVIANPTIMLVDKKKVVVDIYMEDATEEALYEYIKTKTTHNTTNTN